jgi:hypothetical protein
MKRILSIWLLLASTSSFAFYVCGVELTTISHGINGQEISYNNLYFEEHKRSDKACLKALRTCAKIGKIREDRLDETYNCEVVYKEEGYDTDLIAKLYEMLEE